MTFKFKFLTSLFLTTSLIGYETPAEGVSDHTRLDINAQNDVVLSGMKIRLNLGRIQEGPRDQFCTNVGRPFVKKDKNGDFLEFINAHGNSYTYTMTGSPVTYTTIPLDDKALERQRATQQAAINAWGTISWTKRLVNGDLHNILPANSPTLARWNNQHPVKLYTLGNNMQNNAYFKSDSTGGSIHLFPLVKKDGQFIGSTANDFDTVSHETTHNISNILRPNHDLTRPQTGALDESLGDFIALSSALSLKPTRKQFLKETKGNLRRSSFLSETAESISQATGLGPHGIRNALNDFTLDGSACEVHDLSRVFTGALYDIFVDAFEEGCPRTWFSYSTDEMKWEQQITRVNNDLRSLVLATHCLVPYDNPTFADFGYTLYSLAGNTAVYEYLAPFTLTAFENRGINISTPHNDFSICDKKAREQHGITGSEDTHICGVHERLKNTFRH